LVVTDVAIADDLGVARVLVRLLVGDEDERERRAVLRVLARVASRLRRSLAPKLGLKRVPELKFAYDTGLDHSRRVDELLREIAEEAPDSASPEGKGSE
jgi:ribosome-binding factor A